MKKVFLVTALCITVLITHAQYGKLEILRKEIREHPQQDTGRVTRIARLLINMVAAPVDEMDKFSEEALQLSRKLTMQWEKDLPY